MATQTRYVFERFPEQKTQIWRLMLNNPEFRTICSDYGRCIEAEEYWDRSNDPNANVKVQDYRYLSKALEKEIIEALGTHIT